MRLGVIGAGPAGLCAVKHALSFGCEVIAFEQSDKIGGTWNYTDETDKDKNGLDVHSSMYQGLLTNTPKEIMGCPELPFENNEESFVSASAVVDYLSLYAKTFDIYNHVKFEHHVIRVCPTTDFKWEILVKNIPTGGTDVYVFDAVIVCIGFSVPFIPEKPGQNTFQGRQLHSHHYRSANIFQDEKVLVIGGGPSGIDLAVGISKVAERLIWSNHNLQSLGQKVDLKLPENSCEKPDILRFTETGAEFVDGSFEEVSTIIYATGYDYKFPFLSIDCGLQCHEKYVQPLYKHCININRPTMAIIGLPYFAVAMPLFDLQVRFFLTFLTRKKILPTREEMLADTEEDMKERWTRLKRNKAHFLGMEKHEEYYKDLAETARIEPIKPAIAKIFNTSFTNFFGDFRDCRKFCYKIINDENFSMSKHVEMFK